MTSVQFICWTFAVMEWNEDTCVLTKGAFESPWPQGNRLKNSGPCHSEIFSANF
jgi:hypothetical protein